MLALLDARPARSSRLEAGGAWSLQFPARARLKIFTVLAGECWLTLPDQAPLRIEAGATYMLARTAYAMASDAGAPPRDGGELYADSTRVRLGEPSTVMLGGSLELAGVAADLVLDALPAFSPAPRSLRSTLELLEAEADLGARLSELLLIQSLREHGERFGHLADAGLVRALTRMHRDVGHAWTAAELASIAAMSRSAFAARFQAQLGVPPLEYLRRRRMTLARRALDAGRESVNEIAIGLGYASASAFTHAYKREFGTTPGDSRRRRSPSSRARAPKAGPAKTSA